MDLSILHMGCFRLVPRQPPEVDHVLAAVLRQLRDERGDTQEDVAFASGLKPGTVSRIETGLMNPSWLVVRRVADALEVSLVELAEAVERSEE